MQLKDPKTHFYPLRISARFDSELSLIHILQATRSYPDLVRERYALFSPVFEVNSRTVIFMVEGRRCQCSADNERLDAQKGNARNRLLFTNTNGAEVSGDRTWEIVGGKMLYMYYAEQISLSNS